MYFLEKERALRISADAAIRTLRSRKVDIDDFPTGQRPFVNLQFRALRHKRVGKFASLEMQEALSIYHKGPAAYK